MKKIHIRESKLNEIYSEKEFCAGTDHPYYENEETGEVYSADWNSDYGFPFGFCLNGADYSIRRAAMSIANRQPRRRFYIKNAETVVGLWVHHSRHAFGILPP